MGQPITSPALSPLLHHDLQGELSSTPWASTPNSSQQGARPALLPHGLGGGSPTPMPPEPAQERRRARSAQCSDSNMASPQAAAQTETSSWPLMATWASDIKTGPSLDRTLDPDMSSSSSRAWKSSWPQVAAQDTQIRSPPATAKLSDTRTVSCDSPDHEYTHGRWCNSGHGY